MIFGCLYPNNVVDCERFFTRALRTCDENRFGNAGFGQQPLARLGTRARRLDAGDVAGTTGYHVHDGQQRRKESEKIEV